MPDHHIADIAVRTADGFTLAATLLQGPGSGPLALISSATAVPRTFYLKFARALVDAGFRAALVYDYRGISGSVVPKGWKLPIRKRQWAELDMPAAMAVLDGIAPGHPMVGIGQSFGTQTLGLCGQSDRFDRYLMLSAMSGHWRLTDEPYKVFATMQLFGVPLAMLSGSVPGWLGLGETMPGGAFRDWARWSRNRDYFFTDPELAAGPKFAGVTTPILALRPTDDVWATRRAEAALLRHYSNAPIRQQEISPQLAGAPIGHLGFFRSKFSTTLWPMAIDWLAGN